MADLTLDDATISSILNRADVTNAFPWMKKFTTTLNAPARSCCGGRRAPRGAQQVRNAFKQTVSSLSEGERKRLKTLLGVDKIKMTLILGARRIEITI